MVNLLNRFWEIIKNSFEKLDLTRPIKGRILAGVCKGISEKFGLKVELIRVLWLIAIFLSHGSAILIYIILVYMIPIKKIKESNMKNFDYIDGRAWEKK